MVKSKLHLIPLLCFCFAALPSHDACAKGESNNIWIPFQLHRNVRAEDPTRELSDGTKLELGDPKLGNWAIEMTKNAGKLKEEDLIDWMRVVQLYRITEAEPVIMNAVSKLAVNHEQGEELRRTAYFTATVIATEKSKSNLKKLIKARIFANTSPDNRKAEAWHKMQFCAALLALGDSSGYAPLRQDLFIALVKNPNNHVNGFDEQIMIIAKQMAQPGLQGTIQKMLEKPEKQDDEYLHETFGPISKIMSINGQPLSELRLNAATTLFYSEENAMLRNYAIKALAERGEFSDIEFLKSLQRWPEEIEEHEEINERFETSRNDALLVLRCRMWRELLREENK